MGCTKLFPLLIQTVSPVRMCAATECQSCTTAFFIPNLNFISIFIWAVYWQEPRVTIQHIVRL